MAPDRQWFLTKLVGSLIILLILSACVSGNKAEVEANLIKVEKPSTASEVDQYVTTAGRIARFFKQGSE